MIVVDALIGPDLSFQPQTLIEWRDGFLTRIEPAATSDLADTAERVPGVGLPGLIDAHVHLALDGTPDVVAALTGVPADVLDQRIIDNAASYISAGITTVRDLGSPEGVLTRLITNDTLAAPTSPRILPAQAISTPTGHGHFISRHAETFDDYRTIIDSVDVDRHPYLKLFASGGVITSGSDPTGTQMPADVLNAVVAYAHDQGFRIAAHAHSHASIAACVAAGVDTIEHFSYLDDELASLVADSSSYLVSTYVATHRFAHSPERDGAEAEALEKILHHDAIEASALRVAASINHKVIAGSDSGTILNPHPAALHEAAQLMVAAGFSDHDVLLSMTSRSAAALGMSGGELSVGMPADIVVCDNNPATSIAALSTINRVIVSGYDTTL